MSIDIKSSDWDALIQSKKLVAADFWAPWCPYCKMLKPVLESVSQEYENEIQFVKVNVDEEKDIAAMHGIRGIPVVKFFCEGREVGEVVGYVSKDILKQEIDKVAKSTPTCIANTSLKK